MSVIIEAKLAYWLLTQVSGSSLRRRHFFFWQRSLPMSTLKELLNAGTYSRSMSQWMNTY